MRCLLLFAFLTLSLFCDDDISIYKDKKKTASPKTSPKIFITGEKSFYYSKHSKYVYKENVKVVKGDMVMTCEELTVFKNKNGVIYKIIAEKKVIVTSPDGKATGQYAVYLKGQEKIYLKGKPEPKLIKKDSVSQYKEIIYDLKTRIYQGNKSSTVISEDELKKTKK